MNRLGLLAFPRACEDVYLVPARMRRQRGGKAVFLKAAEGVIIIKHETNFHLRIRAAGISDGNEKK